MLELLLGMSCEDFALFTERYNENFVKEFYANLSKDVGNIGSATCGQVFVRGTSLTSFLPIMHTTRAAHTLMI